MCLSSLRILVSKDLMHIKWIPAGSVGLFMFYTAHNCHGMHHGQLLQFSKYRINQFRETFTSPFTKTNHRHVETYHFFRCNFWLYVVTKLYLIWLGKYLFLSVVLSTLKKLLTHVTLVLNVPT